METTTTEEATTEVTPEFRDKYMREILEHKMLVARFMRRVIEELQRRMVVHDNSKFGSFEFEGYLPAYPVFCRSEFGSPEYLEACRIAGDALQRHITTNDHHPECFGAQGIGGMSLIQQIEMVCDWMAASMRNGKTVEGNLKLDINRAKFHIPPDTMHAIELTVGAVLELGEGQTTGG